MRLDSPSGSVLALSVQQPRLGRGKWGRLSEKNHRVAGFECPVRSRRLRTRGAPPHARDLDEFGEPQFAKRSPHGVRALGEHDRVQPRLQILLGVDGVRYAVEEAAEQAVTLLANRAYRSEHAIERNTEEQQKVRSK